MLRHNDVVKYKDFTYKVIDYGKVDNSLNLVSFPNEFQTKKLYNIPVDKVEYKYTVGKT
jgi:hypothetical protein